MIAVSFAYFNFKFSEYKFIDFSEWAFYEQNVLFSPKEERYIVVFYSSREADTMNLLAQTDLGLPLLAIDYYNRVRENSDSTIFLRSGTKTSLSFIQRFNIYESPSIFFIKNRSCFSRIYHIYRCLFCTTHALQKRSTHELGRHREKEIKRRRRWQKKESM